ncbi:MFS transporter [Chromobacterium sp. IIBBL 290-4]|nr:MFS transporter [Chromobacterium sp. IIBBL 290-4]UTH76630.1 MFS transporter [Chromobacterium sp. IIBBL 290-4]
MIFTITLIAVPLPSIGREFALDTASLILVNAAYGLAFSGLLLLGGRLSDRFGGRRVFRAGLLAFGAASAAAGLASGLEMLLAMRFLQGAGAALVAPAALSLLRGVFPEPADFGRAMASWGGVSVLGATAGTVISGVLTSWLSWRWMFGVPFAVCVAALLSLRVWLPFFDEARSGDSLDLGGAALATAGISLASYGLILSGEAGWQSPGVLSPLLAGGAFLFCFFQLERRIASPLLPPGFLAEPGRLAGLIGILLAAASMGLVTFLLSLYLQQIKGWTPLWTAWGFIPYLAALIAVSQIAAPWAARFGAARLLIAGLLLGALGLAWLAGLDRQSSYAAGVLPGLLLLPAGTALMFSASAVMATRDVPPKQAGLAGGVMNTAMELGPTAGLAAFMSVAAAATDAVTGYAWAFAAAAGTFIAAAAAIALLLKASRDQARRLAAENR